MNCPESLRHAVGALLLLSFPAIPGYGASAARGPAVEVAGVVQYAPYPSATAEKPFRVRIEGCRWLITVDPDKNQTRGAAAPVALGFDGERSWFVQDLRAQLAETGRDASRSPAKNVAVGIVRHSPVPATVLNDEIGAIWIALCSSCYFKGLEEPQAEPPTSQGVLAFGIRGMTSYDRLPVQITASEGSQPFHVPSKVVYLREAENGMGGAPAEGTDPGSGAQVAATFEVLNWTNLAGYRLPARSRYWVPSRNGDGSTSEAKPLVQYDVRIADLKSIDAGFAVQPELPGIVATTDTRFPATADHSVSWQSDHWLTDAEVRALPELSQAISSAESDRRFEARRKSARWLAAGLGVLVLGPLVVLGLGRFRQRTQ
ncbi:MAG: hypothetical protein H7A45_13325 [Verrucomicrobiales bacterium]|nr:hypothetical protein [Verrucomicrobiales bacterium]MCP5528317.1 hypothetical protein [Verrucomicrobiales bacterium]